MISVSSQIIAASTMTMKTGVVPTKTLAKPALPGKKCRFSSSHTCSPIPASPSTRATTALACQARLLPALIRVSPTSWSTALTTTSAMITAPAQGCGPLNPAGCHIPCEFSDRR